MIIKPLSIISLKVWLKLVTRGDPCRPLRGKVALKVHQVALLPATSASPILSSGCSKGFISTALYQLHPHTEHSDQGGLYCTFQLLHLRTDFPHFSHASNPRQCSTPAVPHAHHIPDTNPHFWPHTNKDKFPSEKGNHCPKLKLLVKSM